MAITVVQTSALTRTSFGSGNPTVSFSTAPGVGSTILIVVVNYHALSPVLNSVTVNAEEALNDATHTSGTSQVSIWRVSEYPGGTATITVNPFETSGHFITACAIEVTGLDPTEPLGQTANQTSTGSPQVVPSGGMLSVPQFVLGAFGITTGITNNGVVATAGTPLYTESNSNSFAAGGASYIQAVNTLGASVSWTTTSSPPWFSVVAAYKPPPQAGASFVPGITLANETVFVPVVEESIGAFNAGSIPRLGPTGKLDPSMVDITAAGTTDAVQLRGVTGQLSSDEFLFWDNFNNILNSGGGFGWINAGVGPTRLVPIAAGGRNGAQLTTQYSANNAFAGLRMYARDTSLGEQCESWLISSGDLGGVEASVRVLSGAFEPVFYSSLLSVDPFPVLHTGNTRTINDIGLWGTGNISIGASVVVDPLTLSNSTPAAPAANNVRVFGRKLAERMHPAFIGPSGLAQGMQRTLAGANVGYWAPPGNATTVPAVLGFTAVTVTGFTATARNIATTNRFTRMRRLGYVTAATAGTVGHWRVGVYQYTVGGASGSGGFFYVKRFGISDPAAVAGARMFIGMRFSSTPANAEPSTLTNCVGVGHNAAHTNLHIFYGGSAAQTPINLGANFPITHGSVEAYELALFSASNSGDVHWQVTRLSNGNTASGTIVNSGATVLPTETTLLAPWGYRTNNATALAVGLDVMSAYIETDF